MKKILIWIFFQGKLNMCLLVLEIFKNKKALSNY
jgi:hypothetical protein